jgi:long-chain fatty acid transport protein
VNSRITVALLLLAVLAGAAAPRQAAAQAFGVELHATLNPAAGAMGGVCVARPQDVQSAFTGNPATLAQFRGTQFSFGGGWVEPNINVDNDATLPLAGITPFEARSGQPGSVLGNIAVTQDFSAFGLPVTWGAGLLSGVGLGVKYIQAPESNGSVSSLVGLNVGSGVGVQVTERLAVGAQMVVTSAVLDGPFSGLSAATPAYALRGLFGTTYDVGDHTTFGFYWMTDQSFRFDDAIRLSIGGGGFSAVQDINMDLPQTFGWGLANDRLLDGRLLLASDILFKQWSDTDFFGALWEDQFVFQTGLQYQLTRRTRVRLGYAYAENIMRDAPSLIAGGVVPPDGLPAVQYLQSQFPAINEHRLSAGLGVANLLPGIDLDLNAGGMFDTADQFGLSGVSAESYWVAFGLTWRFGRGADSHLPAPNQW